VIEIPFGGWQNWDWYSQHLADNYDIDMGSIRIIFAGSV